MTPSQIKTNDDRGKIKLWLQIVAIVLSATLPGVGFIASQVIVNAKEVAQKTSIPQVSEMIQRHDVQAEKRLTSAMVAIERAQKIRDEALRRELEQIKADLRELARRSK